MQQLKNTLYTICFLLLSQWSQAQFSAEVKEFITVDTNAVAIKDVTLIDGTGNPARTHQTIVMIKERIISVGNNSDIQIPQGALVLDGQGKTVIPGLVMMHEHLFYSKPFENWFSVGQMTFTFPRLYLSGGVTTMRTAGSIQPQTDLNVKKWIEEGKMAGPKMDVTSPFIEREGYDIPELGFLGEQAEVSKLVNYWADKGVTSFKLYNHITKEDLKICVEEAHKRGLKVTGHLCSLTYEDASNLGIDNLEHGFAVASDFINDKEADLCDPIKARNALIAVDENSLKINQLIDVLIKNKTAITATPVVFEPFTNRELIPGGGESALAPQIYEDVKKTYDRVQNRDSASIKVFNKDLLWVKRFYDKGGFLMAGTDPTGAGRTVAGFANKRTVEILFEAGFTLIDAIKICSLNGATYLGQQNDIGTVEAGKIADLILIDGDLTKDIQEIRNMEIVFKNGIGYDPKKLMESVKGKVGLY